MNACALNKIPNKPSSSTLRLLIVDDDKDILSSVRDFLELEDDSFVIETASSYGQAFIIAEAFEPDIALLDIRIGTDNGIDMIQPLKKMCPDIVCIMMTAYRDTEYTVNALRAGADDYLFKPLEPVKLFRTIRQFQTSQNLLRERVLADQRFRAIFNQSFQFLFILDQMGNIIDINNTALEGTGIEKNSVIGSQFTDAPWWSDSDDNRLIIKNAVNKAMKGENVRTEIELHDKEDNRFIFDFSLKPVVNDAGNTIMIIPEGRDISERKKNETGILYLNNTLEQRVKQRTRELEKSRDEAKHANAAKSDFLSRMSHELRTPMNAILGFSEIMLVNGTASLNDEHKECIGHIHTAGKHLLDLINQILNLSHIESGKFNIKLIPVEPDKIIADSIRMLQPLMDNKSITLENQLEENPPPAIKADKLAISQVIINLLANAIKYNHEGGNITIKQRVSTNTPKHLRLTIHDTGIGISKDQYKRVFAPFERTEHVDYVEGTGIGLTLCQRLLSLMDGTIGFDSVEGEGSSFWIELPLA